MKSARQVAFDMAIASRSAGPVPATDVSRLIADLRAELEERDERIRQLEDIVRGKEWALPPDVEAALTPTEARMLALLAAREMCTREALFEASRGVGSHDDATNIKVVDVHVSKMRRRITPLGIVIQSVWGRGYRLDAASRDRLRSWNGEAAAALAAAAFLGALAGSAA